MVVNKGGEDTWRGGISEGGPYPVSNKVKLFSWHCLWLTCWVALELTGQLFRTGDDDFEGVMAKSERVGEVHLKSAQVTFSKRVGQETTLLYLLTSASPHEP